MAKSIDIFIKSYKNDFWLLKYALLSIERNVTGYDNLILLIPEQDKQYFDTRQLPDRTLVYYIREKGDGYLAQQVFKLNAFKYSGAHFVLFSDSDCIFTRKIDVRDYIADDKPVVLHTDWSDVGDAICWKEPTAKTLGWEPEFEFMRRNCQIHHRSTLGDISIDYPHLEEIIMTSKSFSEFNLMGAYAYRKKRDMYNFINTAEWQYTPPLATQVWSHADINGDKTHVYEWAKLLEAILEFNEIEIPKR